MAEEKIKLMFKGWTRDFVVTGIMRSYTYDTHVTFPVFISNIITLSNQENKRKKLNVSTTTSLHYQQYYGNAIDKYL